MKNTKKIFVLALAALLLVAVSIGGTIAYLTDKTGTVENVFTTSNIDVKLEESSNLDLKMIPGKELTKDPTVTVIAGSEACWLFVKMEKSTSFDTYLSYNMAEGWNALDGVTGVYYREVAATDSDVAYPVIAGNKVTVSTSLTNAQMDAIEDANPTLKITAYAIQKQSFATANAAWNEVSTKATEYTTTSTNGEGTNVPAAGN